MIMEKMMNTKTEGNTFTKKIGQTVYVVRYHFNEDAKETMQEKINRMLVTEASRQEMQLTAEFGKGFDKSNLRKMRQFYCTFPIRDTLCPELSWSHYRVLMRINDEQARRFYMAECAKAAWSVRQLQVCRIQKFNMKCEIERMEIIYTFYFFLPF